MKNTKQQAPKQDQKDQSQQQQKHQQQKTGVVQGSKKKGQSSGTFQEHEHAETRMTD